VLQKLIPLSPELVGRLTPLLLDTARQDAVHTLYHVVRQANKVVTQAEENRHLQHDCLIALLGETLRQHPQLGEELLSLSFQQVSSFGSHMVDLATTDWAALYQAFPHLEGKKPDIFQEQIQVVCATGQTLQDRICQAARRDGSGMVLARLVEETRLLVDWQARFFRLIYEQAHFQSQNTLAKAKRKTVSTLQPAQLQARTRLTPASQGPLFWEEPDLAVVEGCTPFFDASGRVSGYQAPDGKRYLPQLHPRTGKVRGYIESSSGALVLRKHSYDFCTPPPDSFSPYDYLHRFFKGCIGLSIIDESHNGKSKDADISQAFRQAMRAAQTRMLTSGTHYGGDILDFFHYWYGFDPSFWVDLGLGWNDATKALEQYGVVEQWTKEYESDARKGSGRTNISTSVVAAPGLSAKVIPRLLQHLVYLTVLDVGAHMPPKIEIPYGISMHDEILENARKQAQEGYDQASHVL
jgi:hypothetical protein